MEDLVEEVEGELVEAPLETGLVRRLTTDLTATTEVEEVEGELVLPRMDRPIVFDTPEDLELPKRDKWGNHKLLWEAIEGIGQMLKDREQSDPEETAERFALELLGRLIDRPGPLSVNEKDEAAQWAKPLHEALENLASWRALVDAIDGNERRSYPALTELLEALQIEIEKRMPPPPAAAPMPGDDDDDGDEGEDPGLGLAVKMVVAQAGQEAMQDVMKTWSKEDRQFAPMPPTMQERMKKILAKLKAKGFREAIEMIGRMVEGYHGPVAEWSDRAVDEYVDLERGSELTRMAACETVRLAHPVLKKVWRAAFLEKRLLQYRVGGRVPRRKRGPMIVLIDESGSMHGEGELQARSMAAAVLYHAASQRRPAWIVPFDTRVVRVDHMDRYGSNLEEMMDRLFAQASGGGTDFNPVLLKALDLIKEEPKADILMITDGEGDLSDRTTGLLVESKKHFNTRLFGYAIGGARGTPQMKALADEWIDIEKAGVDSKVFE